MERHHLSWKREKHNQQKGKYSLLCPIRDNLFPLFDGIIFVSSSNPWVNQYLQIFHETRITRKWYATQGDWGQIGARVGWGIIKTSFYKQEQGCQLKETSTQGGYFMALDGGSRFMVTRAVYVQISDENRICWN